MVDHITCVLCSACPKLSGNFSVFQSANCSDWNLSWHGKRNKWKVLRHWSSTGIEWLSLLGLQGRQTLVKSGYRLCRLNWNWHLQSEETGTCSRRTSKHQCFFKTNNRVVSEQLERLFRTKSFFPCNSQCVPMQNSSSHSKLHQKSDWATFLKSNELMAASCCVPQTTLSTTLATSASTTLRRTNPTWT